MQGTATAKAAPRVRAEPAGRIEIAFERCKACELCIPACPTNCIELGSALNAQGDVAAVLPHDAEERFGAASTAGGDAEGVAIPCAEPSAEDTEA